MADFEVHLDDAAIYELLNGYASPVTRLLEEISEIAAKNARARVPVRKLDRDRSRRHHVAGVSTSFPPGYTLASIRTNVHYYNGLIYGGIAAEEEPTIFLEYPAEQMKREYPFMSSAFDDIYF